MVEWEHTIGDQVIVNTCTKYPIDIIFSATSSGCESPKVSASSYTPSDAQALTHIPFIAEFSLTCKGVVPTADVTIYANIDGNIVQVARSKDGSKYQVGWSTEMKQAKTGDYKIRYFKFIFTCQSNVHLIRHSCNPNTYT